MIKRIVKLSFRPEELDTFFSLFESKKKAIRNVKGCHHLEVWQDLQQPTTVFTYSFWENQQALDAYRHSLLFQETWSKTKLLFAAKPEAWSLKVFEVVRK